ncbi:hypothetical protein [Halomonas salipaludis]|uniref:Uncharacterized protein n=1 Tax=Halomonas salipaludis TaxID=2032625 RepID=A0A2A2F3B2_9GAMM|nr:hypothetical protein [Halomonas salipaludis]PAU79194.1 hypothetical protein CK498_02160 [Halomonas salipaludis]
MDIDDIELLDALRAAVHDPNLGPELAGGLSRLLAAGEDATRVASLTAACDARGSLQAVVRWHRQRQEVATP